MTEKFSFHDNSDFYHEQSCSSKRTGVASVKTYETTGAYTTLRLFKKYYEEFRFNQRITLSAAEFDLLGQKLKTNQDLSSRGTAKKNKRRQRSGCYSDLEERPHYEDGRAKKSRQKLQIKQLKVTKEINYQKWWRQWLSANRNIFVSLPNNIVTLYVKVSIYLTIQ